MKRKIKEWLSGVLGCCHFCGLANDAIQTVRADLNERFPYASPKPGDIAFFDDAVDYALRLAHKEGYESGKLMR